LESLDQKMKMRLQQGFVIDGMGFRVKLHGSNFQPLMSA